LNFRKEVLLAGTTGYWYDEPDGTVATFGSTFRIKKEEATFASFFFVPS
jgi:hypothetical protein